MGQNSQTQPWPILNAKVVVVAAYNVVIWLNMIGILY